MRATDVLRSALMGIVEEMGLNWPAKAVIEPPRDPKHGDLAANIAMLLAREAHKNPRELAQIFVEKLPQRCADIEKVEVAGPGFCNVTFSQHFWRKTVCEVEAAGAAYGQSSVGQGRKTLVEYVSANPTGPLHVGHGRGAAVGDSLARLREQLRIAQAYFEVGLSPRLDVLQAEVDVSEAERLLIEAENTQATTLARLNTLLGFDATAVNTYTGTLKEVGFRYTLEQCLELAYRQRPDLYVAQKAVEIARKSQKEVQSDYYPQIEGYYSMTQSGNTPGMQRSGENGSHVTNWEVGAQATWNVFEWGTTYYADKQAGWQVTKMRYEQENLKLEVGYDIKSKYLAVQEARKRIAVAQNSVAQATEAYNVALARYHEHVGTNFDVLDASANLTSAQSSLTGAKADYLTALSQIYVAMGEYHPDLLREGGAARRK